MKRILYLFQLAAIVLFSQILFAQNAGDLDPSFGDGGKLIIDFGNDSEINDMEILDNGQIMVAGSFTDGDSIKGVIVLLNDDGSIDTSFGEDGFLYVSIEGYDNTEIKAIDVFYPEGKASTSDEGGWWARMESNNWNVDDPTIDVIFFQIKNTPPVYIDPNFGVLGWTEPFPANSFVGMFRSGEPDYNTYVASIFFPTDMPSVTEVRKLDDYGTFDTDFGIDGLAQLTDTSGNDNDIIGTSLFGNTQKFVLVGYEYLTESGTQEAFAAAFNPDGSQEQSFGNQGIWMSDFGSSTYNRAGVFGSNNSIYMGASVWNGDLGMYDKLNIKLTAEGVPDMQFGDGGYGWDSGEDADVEVIRKTEGKIYLSGEVWFVGKSAKDWQTNIFLTRYNEDGSVDETFGDNGDVSTDFGNIYNNANVLKLYEDKILVGGYTADNLNQSMALARYVNDFFVSVDNNEKDPVAVKIYPVPADKFVTVELTGNIKDQYSVSIMNTLGQVVYRADNIIGQEVKKLTISTARLSPGLNTVRIESGENVITKKLIITN